MKRRDMLKMGAGLGAGMALGSTGCAVPGVREVGDRLIPDDMEQFQERRRKEAEALLVCRQKVLHHNLKMKPVDVEYAYDGSRITFYFTANGRIDFRELVRDLARTYRTRIEMWQIGFRAETRRMGGYGICGRAYAVTGDYMASDPYCAYVPKGAESYANTIR